MGDESTLDFGRAQPMTGDIDDVVDPAREPIKPVLVPAGAVAGEIEPRKCREIGLYEPLMITKHRAHHAGPSAGKAEVSFAGTPYHLAVTVDDGRFDTKEGSRRGAWLQRCGTGDRGNQNATGFSLPPGIDDRAALFADMIVIP